MLKKFFRKIANIEYKIAAMPKPETISRMDNQINELMNRVEILENELFKCRNLIQINQDCILDLHVPISQENELAHRPEIIPERKKSLEQCYELLSQEAPSAFKEYIRLMDNNKKCYEGTPLHSCSVNGHVEADRFRKFIQRYLRGYVLDVGCGPQPVPSYLKGYEINRIYGLDPLNGEHPFAFFQGISEFIPWGDNSFDNLIFATSMDHIFLPDKVQQEVKRVLKENGIVLIWTSFDDNAPKYDPYDERFKVYDQYHMFHYSQKQFEKEWETLFEKIEYIKSGTNSHFYAYRLKK